MQLGNFSNSRLFKDTFLSYLFSKVMLCIGEPERYGREARTSTKYCERSERVKLILKPKMIMGENFYD
ncbi:hypothetical protein CMO83_01180 [Candidatus Woesearchaeota archaeon]|nr:hypothetical protein [Candidatus Woesearchaeota archaeon]